MYMQIPFILQNGTITVNMYCLYIYQILLNIDEI